MEPTLLASLVWTGVLGLAVGNYATSFIHRSPKGESPFSKHPYCGSCGTMLAVKDLFPALSWILLKGKCRYCATPIPTIYFLTELFCALIFMAGVVQYGFSELYLLVITAGTFLVITWALEVRTGKVYAEFLFAIAAIGLVSRTLQDHSIYPALSGMIWAAAIPLFWWRLRQDPSNVNGEKAPLVIPPTVSLGATAGIWFGTFGVMVWAVLWIFYSILYMLLQRLPLRWPVAKHTTSFALAMLTLWLLPDFVPLLEILTEEIIAGR